MVVTAASCIFAWQKYTHYTFQRAIYQLNEAGLKSRPNPKVPFFSRWNEARADWRRWPNLFNGRSALEWDRKWRMNPDKAAELRNLDTLVSPLQRVSPLDLDLDACSGLQTLDGIEKLGTLDRLVLLDCSSLQNLDGLRHAGSIRILCLSRSDSLRDVDSLKGLKGLLVVSISEHTGLKDLGGLHDLPDLACLHLIRCTALQNVDALKGMKRIQDINLGGCTALQNVDGLLRLTSLRTVNLNGCSMLSQNAVAALKIALPNTEIIGP